MVEIINNIPLTIGGIIGVIDINNISRKVDKELKEEEFYRKKNSFTNPNLIITQFSEPESNHTR